MRAPQEARMCASQKRGIPPRPKKNHLPRKRLVEKALASSKENTVVIVAPPGYGKSSLVGELYWAMEESDPGRTLFLDAGKREEYPVHALLDYLEEADAPSELRVLVDDAQLIPDDQTALLLDALQRAADRRARVFIASTAWTDSLVNACMRQDIVVLGKKELSLSESEVATCLKLLTGEDVSEGFAQRVYAFTCGWPAGVHLLAINVQGNQASPSFARNKFIDAYFASMLKEGFSQDEFEFMLMTSCLDEMTESACDYVTERSDSGAMIKRLDAKGAYLSFTGNDTDSVCHYDKHYRAWLLDTLLRKHRALGYRANNRAARYYALKHDAAKSVKHMLMTGDSMENFKELWGALGYGAEGCCRDDLMLLISAIDPQEILENPFFDVLAAWLCIRSGRPLDARACASLCRDHAGEVRAVRAGAGEVIDAHLACIEAKCLNMEGEDESYVSVANSLLRDDYVSGNIGLRCVLTHGLAESYEHLGEISRSQDRYRESLALSDLCSDVFARGLSAYSIARHKLMTGNFLESEKICLSEADRCTDSYKGLLMTLLAREHTIIGDLPQARRFVEQARLLLSDGLNADFRFELDIAEAFICELDGDLQRASSLIMSSVLAAKSESVRQRNILRRTQVEWARLLLRKHDYSRCKELLDEIGGEASEDRGEMSITVAAAQASLALAEGATDQALEKTQAALGAAKEIGFVVYWVDLKILEARIYAASGKSTCAFLSISEALDSGARFGLRTPFIRENEEILDLLNESMSERKLKRATRGFCKSLLQEMGCAVEDDPAIPAPGGSGVRGDLLTAREKEILALLNKGLSRKEISAELGIAHNTTKAHIAHIYEKLGVNNKLDAFHAAREAIGL